ncbi:uncharacterized protein LOC108024366 [Drosophila biarmipes]|uniref:uncharacterized protein LOC108024366 n=1 Tax=Drosophila biarmipes TaxID=125945 RepID=UPI0021CC9AB8|nr:uncharacterized protein LOC108024366 [Drosophila biarmipes]
MKASPGPIFRPKSTSWTSWTPLEERQYGSPPPGATTHEKHMEQAAWMVGWMGMWMRICLFASELSTMKPAVLLCLILTSALFLGQGRGNPVDVEVPSPEINAVDTVFDEEDATDKPLGIVSIKVRHLQPDPELCAQVSRYHPHHPQCHNYCKRQGHWIGQCKKEACHCFS